MRHRARRTAVAACRTPPPGLDLKKASVHLKPGITIPLTVALIVVALFAITWYDPAVRDIRLDRADQRAAEAAAWLRSGTMSRSA